MKKYLVLAACVLIEVLLGFQYSWAIFDRVLQERYEFTATRTQAVFSTTVVFFAVSFILSGRVVNWVGPRVTTVIGAVTYGLGLVLAGWGGANFTTLLVGAGVMVGAGTAFAYIGPLVTAVKWFPGRKGIAAGVVVGSFASGAFFLGALAKTLLARDFSIFAVFVTIGLGGLAGIVPLSFALCDPPQGAGKETVEEDLPKGLLKTGFFWSLVAALFCGTFAGLVVMGSLEKIGKTLGAPEACVSASVLVLSIGNTIGRAGWGFLTELVGTRRAVVAALGLQAVFIGTLAFVGYYGPAFIALSFVIGFNYGGNFVLYVTEVARAYGPGRVGTVYALIYVVYAVSGLSGPQSAGYSYVRWGSYVPALWLAAGIALTGVMTFMAVYSRPADAGL